VNAAGRGDAGQSSAQRQRVTLLAV